MATANKLLAQSTQEKMQAVALRQMRDLQDVVTSKGSDIASEATGASC